MPSFLLVILRTATLVACQLLIEHANLHTTLEGFIFISMNSPPPFHQLSAQVKKKNILLPIWQDQYPPLNKTMGKHTITEDVEPTVAHVITNFTQRRQRKERTWREHEGAAWAYDDEQATDIIFGSRPRMPNGQLCSTRPLFKWCYMTFLKRQKRYEDMPMPIPLQLDKLWPKKTNGVTS